VKGQVVQPDDTPISTSANVDKDTDLVPDFRDLDADNDGINDVFTLFGNSPNVQMVEEFKIFDRWGSLIFESGNFLPNDSQSGWNGTFNGEGLPTGVYVYTATIRFIDEQVFRYSGDVFLIK